MASERFFSSKGPVERQLENGILGLLPKCISLSMVCTPVRGDNQRGSASGLFHTGGQMVE